MTSFPLGVMCRNVVRPVRPALERFLPKDAFWFLAHQYAKWNFHRFMKRQVTSHWFRPIAPGPSMSKELRLMTKAFDQASFERPYTDNHFFFDSYCHLLYFLQLLSRFSFNLRITGAVLEFGCGSARLLRLLRCIEGLRLVGADANPACVEWCKENVPGPEYYANELAPPLSFAEDGSFDLVLAYSVFTHIPLDLQIAWLKELRRVLRPGGMFVCTVLGCGSSREMLDPEGCDRLNKEGALTLSADDPRASLSTQVIGSWDVFQTRHQVIRNFGSVFCIREFLPAIYAPMGQDILVLQKPLQETQGKG